MIKTGNQPNQEKQAKYLHEITQTDDWTFKTVLLTHFLIETHHFDTFHVFDLGENLEKWSEVNFACFTLGGLKSHKYLTLNKSHSMRRKEINLFILCKNIKKLSNH